MIDMLAELNDQQREAAAIAGGPTLVIAGPGTGKTKTLVTHAAHLISKRQVDPTQILILAFTKKNAQELQTRMQKEGMGRTKVSTFHALCFELIGRDAPIATDVERLQIIANLPKPAAYRGLSTRELALHFSKAKNTVSESPVALQRLRQAYDKALEASGLIDFDDLLVRAYDLLSADAKVRSKTQFSHVLIDEFQDTNYLQYELVKLLCQGSNLFAIGDPNQSIYGFRGASGGIFDQFRSDFPKTKTITLTVNYRSCPEIVTLGNATFPEATALSANKTAPGRVQGMQVYNEYSEADWVLDQIQGAIGGSDMLRATDHDGAGGQRTLREFAILYRNRSAATVLHKRIAESGLPYQIVGEGSPYEQPQIQTIIRILRSISSGEASGVSRQEKNVSELLKGEQYTPPSTLAERAIAILGLEASVELHQLVGTLVRFSNLAEAIGYFDKIAEMNFYDPDAEAITLLTIHASKGLEFPSVFLIACEEDILPYDRADAGEEKRLFYVAVTRAQDRLEVVYTKRRAGRERVLSRFAAGMPPDILPKVIDDHMIRDQKLAVKRAIKRSQQSLF